MSQAKPQHLLHWAARVLLGGIVAAAALTGTGCADATSPFASAFNGDFEIQDIALSRQSLVGREGFSVTLTVNVPAGHAITGYVLSTQYEQTRHDIEVPLTPIQGGYIILREVQFDREPVAGAYHMQIKLLDEAGDESNALTGTLTVH
ncbi:MAG TPA: hypothetical protein V6D47_15575 [Oscillatoriaceae cyanobacterium]